MVSFFFLLSLLVKKKSPNQFEKEIKKKYFRKQLVVKNMCSYASLRYCEKKSNFPYM